jgi:DNA polymerase-3 subunit delta'
VPTPLLSTVLGQDTAITTLRRALARSRVHHAYLFDGADGVGKERTAFGLAQALVCERRQPGEENACGECSACIRSAPKGDGTKRPLHPDIIVIERGLYEPTQIGRRTPETQDISIDQVRTLVLTRAAFGPHEGRAKVFVIRRADELSTSAANALLKTLEEPGDKTHFILLSSQPDSLLSTIRSRTQRLRFAPLSDAIVTRLLTERGVEPSKAEEIARLAGGSVDSAIAISDPEATEERSAFVTRALAAIDAPGLGPALDLAEEAKKTKADLALRIAALANALAERASANAAKGDDRCDADAARYKLALAAIRQLDANGSAQLVVESMMSKMR